MDTDGIKQNVTQTSLQPPGLLNPNVGLLVEPKITPVSDLNVQKTASQPGASRVCFIQRILYC